MDDRVQACSLALSSLRWILQIKFSCIDNSLIQMTLFECRKQTRSHMCRQLKWASTTSLQRSKLTCVIGSTGKNDAIRENWPISCPWQFWNAKVNGKRTCLTMRLDQSEPFAMSVPMSVSDGSPTVQCWRSLACVHIVQTYMVFAKWELDWTLSISQKP